MKTVEVKCRKCGRSAPADSFVLDHVYRMVVCPNCAKDRKRQESIHKEVGEMKKDAKQKPKDWDDEDAMLEKMHKPAPQPVHVEPIDSENVRIKCPKCSYTFKFNKVRMVPRSCPYCNTPIKAG